MAYDNTNFKPTVETPLIPLKTTGWEEYSVYLEKLAQEALEEYCSILNIEKDLSLEDIDTFTIDKYYQYQERINKETSINFTFESLSSLDYPEMNYLKYQCALEGVWDSLKQIGDKIMDFIEKIVQYLINLWDKLFGLLPRVEKKLLKAEETLRRNIGKSFYFNFDVRADDNVADFCYYGGKNHDLHVAVEELSYRYHEMFKAFDARFPPFLDLLEVIIDNIDKGLPITDNQATLLINQIYDILSPVDPKFRIEEVNVGGQKQIKETLAMGVNDKGQSVVFSNPYPGDYRIISNTPLPITTLKASLTKLTGRNGNLFDYETVLIGEITSGEFTRGGSDEVHLTDVLNTRFVFEYLPLQPQINPQTGLSRNTVPKVDKSLGLDKRTLKITLDTAKYLVKDISRDKGVIEDAKRRAKKIISKLRKLKGANLDTANNVTAGTMMAPQKNVKLATLFCLKTMDKPYTTILKYTIMCCDFIAEFILTELERAYKERIEQKKQIKKLDFDYD